MASHLIAAWSIYKDIYMGILILSHTHTHATNACIPGDGLIEILLVLLGTVLE